MTYETGRRNIHQLADRLRFQANIWNGNEQEFTDLLSHIKNSIDTAKQEGKNEKALEIATTSWLLGITYPQSINEITNRIKK